MLTVLVSTISNSQVFLLKKKSYSHFFSKNIRVYAIFNVQSFNDTLTNNINSFKQMSCGAGVYTLWLELPMSRTNLHGPKDACATEIDYLHFTLW